MKNRYYLIILTIQFMLVLVFLVYAFVQKAEAEVQRQEARMNAIEAAKNAEAALQNRSIAERQNLRADSLQAQLNKLLQTCGK